MSATPRPARLDHFVGATAGENVWLRLTQLAEQFGRDKSVVSRHIKNIYDEGELTEDATVAVFATVQSEPKPCCEIQRR
jgi:hypothetical protein